MNKNGFTLAEVLITLAIIGVVAALTIPSLVAQYQKRETVTKLKDFYSIMSQAFIRAKIDHGEWDTWRSNYCYSGTADRNTAAQCQLKWLETYLFPYIKNVKIETKGIYVLVALSNGSGFSSYNDHFFFCLKYSDCQEKVEDFNTRTRFLFSFSHTKGFETYHCGWRGSRDEILNSINSCNHTCSKDVPKHSGLCARLIQLDSWTIAPDYPW